MILAACAVAFFSIMGFWKQNTLMFMIAAGASLITGLYWYDTYFNNLGLAIGLLLIVYSLCCLGFGLGCLFKSRKIIEE